MKKPKYKTLIETFKTDSKKPNYWNKFDNADSCLDDIDIDSDHEMVNDRKLIENSDSDDENMNDYSDRNNTDGYSYE